MKKILPLIIGVAVAGVAYYLWWRSKLPSNWDTFTSTEKKDYLAALKRAQAMGDTSYLE